MKNVLSAHQMLCLWCGLLSVFLLPSSAFCDARTEAAKKASAENFHKEGKHLLDTALIGYTLIRQTPEGDLFYLKDLTDNSYFLFPSSAISPELEGMLRQSYMEGKFVKLNGLVVTWENKTESGFYIDATTAYEWADPMYMELRTQLELKKQKEEMEKRKTQQQTTKDAERKKKDPAHLKELEEQLRAHKEARGQNAPPPQK